jgi:hypothetical protein
MSEVSTLEVVGEETAKIANKGAQAILSEISFAKILRDLDLLPPMGWRHLVLNLATKDGEDRIDEDSRWIYAERLFGSIGATDPRELLLVAFGQYQSRAGATAKDTGLGVRPTIEGCAALECGSVDLLKAVGFPQGDISTPTLMESFEFSSKLRHARSQLGNPVIYRKSRKKSEKGAAA